MANRRFTQFYNTLHTKPVQLDCKFLVNSSDSAGLGITSLKGPGIAAVYMHTSATPATGSPNPAAGYIVVKFQDNYSQYYFGSAQITAPQTGAEISISSSSVLTIGNPYVISTVGTSTAANWQAVGLPNGITPAVGYGFIASVTGSGTGTGKVKAVGKSVIETIEQCFSPTLGVSSASAAIVGGVSQASYMILQCLAATNSSTTTLVPTAPADGSAIHLSFVLSSSWITVNGD